MTGHLRKRLIRKSAVPNEGVDTGNIDLSPTVEIKECKGEADILRTPIQVAELLGVSIGTLSVWRSTGRYPLKYIKLGGLVRYRLSDVLEFLNSRTKSGVSDSAEGENE